MHKKLETVTIKPEVVFVEKDNEYRLIDNDVESRMDSYIVDFNNYIQNENGKDASEEEKDALYVKAQDFIRNLKIDLRDSKFKFYINRPQYMFLIHLIRNKIEYDVNTIFIVIEIAGIIESMENMKFKDDNVYLPVDMTPTEVTYLYHTISSHKVKGLTKDAYLFADILRRIGEILKIVEYYDSKSKALTNDISIWAANLGGIQLVEGIETFEEIQENESQIN